MYVKEIQWSIQLCIYIVNRGPFGWNYRKTILLQIAWVFLNAKQQICIYKDSSV